MNRTSLTSQPHVGILPSSEKYGLKLIGWQLPGHGDRYSDCGEWRLRGCDNREGHPQGIDGRPRGGVFVEVYKRRCFRATCPECYESWAGREGERVAHRIKHFRPVKFRLPIHVSASVPKTDWSLDYRVLRRNLYKYLQSVGIIGGCAIFHPWREDEGSKRWYFGPHFHVIGFGWVIMTKDLYLRSGWIVKNLGVRKSVQSTVMYQLSHAGISRAFHTVTWFGELSYNKLKVPPLSSEEHLCPICGSDLKTMFFGDIAGLDPPRKEGFYYVTSSRVYEFELKSF